MGRSTSDGIYRLGYGVIIKQPKDPSWPIMVKRLKSFDYDQSLFATAARATPKGDLDDEGIPEQITKSAKKTMQPVLISFRDTAAMSEEEKKIQHWEFEDRNIEEHSRRIENLMCAAIRKVLGEDTKVRMKILTANTGFLEDDDEYIEPVMFLEAVQCISGEMDEPTVVAKEVNIPSIENPEDVAKDISLVLKALGLEADRPKPGWRLVVGNSCRPDY